MRHCLLIAAFVCVFAPALMPANPPDTGGGLFNSCTSASYGGPYNWLQFTNNCGQATFIEWFWRSGDYIGSGATAQVGGTVSTGLTSREVSNKRGYELYICPAGSIAVDASDSTIKNGGSNPQNYKCKPQ
jgi:hypothetical protein